MTFILMAYRPSIKSKAECSVTAFCLASFCDSSRLLTPVAAHTSRCCLVFLSIIYWRAVVFPVPVDRKAMNVSGELTWALILFHNALPLSKVKWKQLIVQCLESSSVQNLLKKRHMQFKFSCNWIEKKTTYVALMLLVMYRPTLQLASKKCTNNDCNKKCVYCYQYSDYHWW